MAILAIPSRSWEMRLTLAVPLGLGVMSFLVYSLGKLHLLFPWVFAALTGAIIVTGLLARGKGTTNPLSFWERVRVRVLLGGSPIHSLALILIAIAALLLLLRGLSPVDNVESAPDEMRFYASMSRQYIANNTTDILKYQPAASTQPQAAEMVFIWGMLLGGDGFPRLFSAFVLLLVAVGIYSAGKDVLHIRLPALGAALFLATPFTLSPQQGLAHARPLLVLFSFAAVYVLCLWVQNPGWRLASLMGGMVGLAMSTQLLGLSVAAAIGLVAVWIASRRLGGRQGLECLLAFAVAATLIGGFWYARCLVETGSPLYPVLTKVIAPAGAYWNEFLEFRIGNHARGGEDAIAIPRVSPASIARYLLPFLPALLLLARRNNRSETVSLVTATSLGLLATIVMAPTALASEIRYLYHLFPLFSLMAAAALGGYTLCRPSEKDGRAQREGALAAVKRPIAYQNGMIVIAAIALFALPWFFAWPVNASYITTRLMQLTGGNVGAAQAVPPTQLAVLKFARGALPPGTVILAPSDAHQFFTDYPMVLAPTWPIAAAIFGPNDIGAVLAALESNGITHVIDQKYGSASATEIDRDSTLFLPGYKGSVLRPLDEAGLNGWVLYEVRYDAAQGRQGSGISLPRINADLASPERADGAWKVTPSNRSSAKGKVSWTVWQLLQDYRAAGSYAQAPALLTYRVQVETSGRYELWSLDIGQAGPLPYGLVIDGIEMQSSAVGRRTSDLQWRRVSSVYLGSGEHTVGVALPTAASAPASGSLSLAALFLEPEGSPFISLALSTRPSAALVAGDRLVVDEEFDGRIFSGAAEGFLPKERPAGVAEGDWFSWTTGKSSIYFAPVAATGEGYRLSFVTAAMPKESAGRKVNVEVNGHQAGSFTLAADRPVYQLPLDPDWLKGPEIEVFFESGTHSLRRWWPSTGLSVGIPIRSVTIEKIP